MKALSLTQPWATLIAIGAKRVETRSWHTLYTGPVLIHAAKGFPGWARDLTQAKSVRDAVKFGWPKIAEWENAFPLGAIVAKAKIMGCRLTQDVVNQLSETEVRFGDYDSGRFAWFLSDIEPLPKPIPAKGALGLWEWNG